MTQEEEEDDNVEYFPYLYPAGDSILGVDILRLTALLALLALLHADGDGDGEGRNGC